MKRINLLTMLSSAAFLITLILGTPTIAAAQSSGSGGNIGAGNVLVAAAGKVAQNESYGNAGPDQQGGTFSSGTPININFYVYGVQGGGSCSSPTNPTNSGSYCQSYVLASCVGGSTDSANQSSIYYSKSYSNISTEFSWTPPGPGNYFIQCDAEYVPGSSQGGGFAGGTAETGRILFSVTQ